MSPYIPRTQTANHGNEGRPRAKVAVFCGSSSGTDPAYVEAAKALGRALAEQNIDLGMFPATF
jgi:predicted Rossmann-fold nucleotide-binding protein